MALVKGELGVQRLDLNLLDFSARPQAQPVQIGQRAHHVGIDELLDQLVAQALDFHGAAVREMQNRLLALRRAKQPAGAAAIGFALFAHHRRAAHRALAGHGELRRIGHALVRQHADDFGNHVARAAHDDRVAHAHVFAPRFVLVVQRGVGHGHAADKHRREFCHRREFAGAPDLHVNGQHGGQLLLRRVFVRHGPARLAGFKAQITLQRQAVDFVNHAVDVVRQLVALLSHVLVKGDQFSRATRQPGLFGHRKAP